MFDGRTNLSADVAAEVRRHLGDRVFETVVPRSVRLSEAPSHGLPIALYSPDSRRRDGLQRARRRAPRRGTARRRTASTRRDADAPSDGRERRMTIRPDRTTGLGRGLSSLIPQRPQRRPASSRSRRAASARTRTSRAARFDADELAALAASIARARHHPADPRDRDRSTATSSSPASAGCAPRGRPASSACRRWSASSPISDQLELALVENLQRSDLDADRDRPGLSPADRRVRPDPGRGRRARRSSAIRPSRTRSACSTSRRRSRPPIVDGRLDRRPRPRARRPARRDQDRVLDSVHQPGAVRPPDRRARPPHARTEARGGRTPRTTDRIPTWSASRRTCADRSAPRSAWPDRDAGDASSSSTTATKNWGASTSA